MKEQLISFNTAKLAKEKGFGMTDDCYIQLSTFYYENGSLIAYEARVKETHSSATGSPYGQKTINDFKAYISVMDNSLDDFVLAPTQSLLQKWLREEHNIGVYIYDYIRFEGDLNEHRCFKCNINLELVGFFKNTYEEALERGLQKALKLINP